MNGCEDKVGTTEYSWLVGIVSIDATVVIVGIIENAWGCPSVNVSRDRVAERSLDVFR